LNGRCPEDNVACRFPGGYGGQIVMLHNYDLSN
jgi:hypothetical protein